MTNTPRIDRNDKNFIINGNMDYAQRKPSGTVTIDTNAFYRAVDRFIVKTQSGLLTGTTERDSLNVPTNGKSRYSLKTTATPLAAANRVDIQQRIESKISRELVGENVSFGAWVYSESSTEVLFQLRYPNTIDDYSGGVTVIPEASNVQTIPLGEWTFIKFENIPIPSSAFSGLEFLIGFREMSVLSTPVSHYISQSKLNIGDFAQNFSYFSKNLYEELPLCLYYYRELTSDATATIAERPILPAIAISTAVARGVLSHDAPFRTLPAVVQTGNFALAGQGGLVANPTVTTVAVRTDDNGVYVFLNFNAGAGLVDSQLYYYQTTDTSAVFALDAELS